MAEPWENLPDIVPAKESWEDLPDVDPQVKGPVQTTEQDEATQNAYSKEKALETALTFFGNGGPTAALRGAIHATAPQGPPGVPTNARPGEGLLEHYRRVRDETKRSLDLAERRGPQADAFGVKFNPVALAGAAAPSLIAPNPTTLLGRLALGGFLGGTQSAIQSDADLTKGEVTPFLKDTGKGALYGLGASGVAEGLTAPMRMISKGAASRIGDTVATKAAQDVADVGEEISSLKGQLGGESQKMSRLFENTQRAAGGGVAPAGQTAINPALQNKALLALSDPSTARLQEKVIERGLGEMPGQAATVSRLEQELAQRSAGQGTEAAKRTSDFFAKPTIKTDVLPRIGRQLQNAAVGTAAALPAAVGFGATGGKAGAIGALLAGAGTGLAKGALNSARTTMANPRLQVGALEGLIRSSQSGQKALQTAARTAAATEPKLEQEQEDAVQAFLSGG